jgi:hypothetical protein
MQLKKLRLLLLLMISPFVLVGQLSTLVNENFASGIPASWQSSGASTTANNGKTCVSMASSGFVSTVTIDKPGAVSFSHRASGNGKILSVQKSVNGGAWTTVGTVSPSSASTWGSSSVSVNEGSKNVQIRFLCSSATIYLTDIVVSGAPAPQLSVSPAELDFGTVFEDESSSVLSVQLNAAYLADDISVNAQGAGFEVSSDGVSFFPSIVIAQAASMPATIYARYVSPHVAVGAVSGSMIVSTSDAQPVAVSMSATSGPKVPTIITSPKTLSFGYVLYGNVSDVRSILLEGKYLSDVNGNVSCTSTDYFEISMSADGPFSQSLQLPFVNGSMAPVLIYARFAPVGSQHLKSFQGQINLVGGDSNSSITLNGIGVTSLDGISRHYYISPSGSDAVGSGTLSSPWYSLSKAVTYAQAGDTIHCRGGVYNYSQTIRLEGSGSTGKRIHIFAYQNDQGVFEQPVFDFSNQP